MRTTKTCIDITAEIKSRKKQPESFNNENISVYIMTEQSEKERLEKDVRAEGTDNFKLIQTDYDANLIIGPAPHLGKHQRTSFAARDFAEGEVVMLYLGDRIFEEQLKKEDLDKKLKDLVNDSDCIFQGVDNATDEAFAVDAKINGSLGRFINHDPEYSNVSAHVNNNKIEIIANRNIKFGEELLINYGDIYFDDQLEVISRQPRNLLEVYFGSREIDHSIQNIHDFKWQILNDYPNNVINFSWNGHLYLDDDHSPLLFNNKKDLTRLGELTHTKIVPNAKESCYIMPVSLDKKQRVFSLFAAATIEKGETVCRITGRETNQNEIDTNPLINKTNCFAVGKKVIDANIGGSEALFIHGRNNRSDTNVDLIKGKNGYEYIAHKKIHPGDEVVAFFESPIIFARKKLNDVVENINKTTYLTLKIETHELKNSAELKDKLSDNATGGKKRAIGSEKFPADDQVMKKQHVRKQ